MRIHISIARVSPENLACLTIFHSTYVSVHKVQCTLEMCLQKFSLGAETQPPRRHASQHPTQHTHTHTDPNSSAVFSHFPDSPLQCVGKMRASRYTHRESEQLLYYVWFKRKVNCGVCNLYLHKRMGVGVLARLYVTYKYDSLEWSGFGTGGASLFAVAVVGQRMKYMFCKL